VNGPGYLTPAEREYDRLDEELANASTDEERKSIRESLRDIEREEGDRERWEQQGNERGWL
jgi:hypothetical protein